VLPLLPPGLPLDEVIPKPRGEALLLGSAHAPGGKPVTAMCVRLAVGQVDKRLRVVGERGWRQGSLPGLGQVSDPEPFTSMPIDWQRAYGGPGHPANPAGCGYTGLFAAARTGCMPNIEYAGAPVSGHATLMAPAGFGPLEREWAPRKGKLGTYDARWLAGEAPGFARDIDWTAFNLAPEDQ
jgi:hypothetical protein